MGVALLDLMKDDAEVDRTFKRYRMNFPLSVAPAGVGEGKRDILPGLAQNVSLSGIGFVCFGRFELEDLLDIEITLESQRFVLLSTIRRRQPLDLNGDAMYHYGTQFERTEDVLRFIPIAAQFMLTHGADRRTPTRA